MQQLQINVSKNNAIHTLLHKRFPAIKSGNNQQTYYVTPKTISYIHLIVTDCITRLPTDACTQRAPSMVASAGETDRDLAWTQLAQIGCL
jgi:hypothetical protein